MDQSKCGTYGLTMIEAQQFLLPVGETDVGPLLVFPSYFNRELRDQIDHPSISGEFRFGRLEDG